MANDESAHTSVVCALIGPTRDAWAKSANSKVEYGTSGRQETVRKEGKWR